MPWDRRKTQNGNCKVRQYRFFFGSGVSTLRPISATSTAHKEISPGLTSLKAMTVADLAVLKGLKTSCGLVIAFSAGEHGQEKLNHPARPGEEQIVVNPRTSGHTAKCGMR